MNIILFFFFEKLNTERQVYSYGVASPSRNAAIKSTATRMVHAKENK